MVHPEYVSNYEALIYFLQLENQALKIQLARAKEISRKRKSKINSIKKTLAKGTYKERSCTRKKSFKSREEAQCWVQASNQESYYKVYDCKYCGAHHLATKR